MFLFKLKKFGNELFPSLVSDPSFKFLDLAYDLQKMIFEILLLDPFCYNAEAFLNLSFSCKSLFQLGLLVLSEQISKGNFIPFFAIPNETENYLDLYMSRERLYLNTEPRTLKWILPEKTYTMKTSYYEKKFPPQIKNEKGIFSFLSKEKKFSIFQSFLEAKAEGDNKGHFYDVGAKFTHYYYTKPPIFETLCIKQAAQTNEHSNIPYRAIFFKGAFFPYANHLSKFKLSQPNGFVDLTFKKCLVERRHDNPERQYEYDKRFGLTVFRK